jgi:hypothetical protein
MKKPRSQPYSNGTSFVRLMRAARPRRYWSEEEVLELAHDLRHLSAEQVLDYLQQTLDEEERRVIEAHAAECSYCLGQLVELVEECVGGPREHTADGTELDDAAMERAGAQSDSTVEEIVHGGRPAGQMRRVGRRARRSRGPVPPARLYIEPLEDRFLLSGLFAADFVPTGPRVRSESRNYGIVRELTAFDARGQGRVAVTNGYEDRDPDGTEGQVGWFEGANQAEVDSYFADGPYFAGAVLSGACA